MNCKGKDEGGWQQQGAVMDSCNQINIFQYASVYTGSPKNTHILFGVNMIY